MFLLGFFSPQQIDIFQTESFFSEKNVIVQYGKGYVEVRRVQ